jgi:amino acid adenylation domain-containing protein
MDREPQSTWASEVLVPGLVAAWAAATPEAVAVEAQGQQLSYRELDHQSNQLAHHLQGLGVGPDVLVGLCVERAPGMVVGALAILKAGGAYVPLDPSYPADRLVFMLQDANAPVLVTQWHLLERMEGVGCQVVAMDADASLLAGLPTAPPPVGNKGSDVAYVIYTSGSTGHPKGVEVSHGSLLNLVQWHRRAFAVSGADRATQLASTAFDAVVWELWPYLTAGASLHMPEELTRATPSLLRDWLVKERITIGFVPTALAEALIQLEWPPETALRTLLTGADALHKFPPPGLPYTLVNNYGPTEATVVATSGTIPTAGDAGQVPSIGGPIDGVLVHIVDKDLQPVEQGAVGELLIGGAGVARGYLNRPELTRERFLPDTISGTAGGRLYRTGDLVRARPDGELEFIGRGDDQVKIRGQRLELGEITTTLNTHPSVHSSVVIVDELISGERQLVAFVVPAEGAVAEAEPLRTHLAGRLPSFMLPTDFVWLPEFPTTPSGKVDRSALAALRQANSSRTASAAVPRNQLEEALVAIVAELLGLETVGTDENFFTLGGHSLLGAQVIARIGDRFGVEMSLRSLFDQPTVAEMAVEVERLLVADLNAMSDEEAERLAGIGPEGG